MLVGTVEKTNEIKSVKYQKNEYLMIPNECVVHGSSVQGFLLQRFEVTAVSLLDLVSHMIAMSALCVADLFALRCVLDVIDLLSS